jgi:membrane associated rhomboid family serine protease
MNYRTGPLANTPNVVKNLVIINALFYLVKYLGNGIFLGQDMDALFGLHYISSPEFRPWQLVTHMFMHGGFWHLFLNMFGIFMLGAPLEYRWGSQRFLLYYGICGIGAGILYMGVQAFDYVGLVAQLEAGQLATVKAQGMDALTNLRMGGDGFGNDAMNTLSALLFTDMVGASGALFGVMVAFGMLYPNVELMIFPLPIPIKAKFLITAYAAYELYAGLNPSPTDNVAHFAHIGGLVVGIITILIWRKRLPYT